MSSGENGAVGNVRPNGRPPNNSHRGKKLLEKCDVYDQNDNFVEGSRDNRDTAMNTSNLDATTSAQNKPMKNNRNSARNRNEVIKFVGDTNSVNHLAEDIAKISLLSKTPERMHVRVPKKSQRIESDGSNPIPGKVSASPSDPKYSHESNKNQGSDISAPPKKGARNRSRKKRVPQGDEKNDHTEKTEIVPDNDDPDAVFEAERKAREEAEIAEAARLSELRRQKEARHNAMLEAKQQLESKISSACERLFTNYIQVALTHQSTRDRLVLDRLTETRSNFQQNKKNLKSDLKKCTAFCKKIRSTQSWESNGVVAAMIQDVETLNLSRYIEEIVTAFLECKLKVGDISGMVAICVALHERYDEFRDELLQKLISVVTSKGQMSPDDAKQKRIYLRLLTELLLVGVILDPRPIVRIISDACGAPISANSEKYSGGVSYAVTDAALLVSFARAAGSEVFGITPRSVVTDIEFLKGEIERYELMNVAVCQNQSIASDVVKIETMNGSNDEIVYFEFPTVSSPIINEAHDIVSRAIRISELRAVPENISQTIRIHAAGAFKTLCATYVSTHKKLTKLEKRCEEDRLLTGTINEQREKGLIEAQKLMETLKKSVETLADVLNEEIPVLQVEVEETASTVESSGVELYKGGEERDINLGPFDDEETRSFYCDIPDFLSTIPAALLGYTPEEVERLKSANTIKFKPTEPLTETDDSVNIRPENEVDTDVLDDAGATGDEVTASMSADQDGDGKSDGNPDNPQYKLMILLEQLLPDCNRRDKIDEVAEKFCVNHGSTKNSRRRIQKALFQVRRVDLLPFYSRLAAIFDRVYPEIAAQLVTEVETQFHGLARWKKQQNIEHRIRNARFIGELTKFRVAPPIVPLRCLQRCLLDFTGHNVDVACCLLESCGRYLHRTKHTNAKVTAIMDNIIRMKKVKFFDERLNALIDSALYMVVPPTVSSKVTKTLGPLEAYLKNLLLVRLTPEESDVSFISKQLLRFPWSDPGKDCGALIAKYLLKACRKGRYRSVLAVSSLISVLKKSKPEIFVRVLDTAIEELQRALENPSLRDNQRTLVYCRLLGEMCSIGLVGADVILSQLFMFVNFGHEVPQALKEASHLHDSSQSELEISKSVTSKLLKGPLGITQSIKEDEELDGNEFNLSSDRLTVVTPVAVSTYAKHDPRVPSLLDPPTAVFRIKLVCTLMDSCSASAVSQMNKSQLNHFLAAFQRYIFTKESIPADIEFSILDTFDLVDSRLVEKKQESRKLSLNDGIVRYKSWLDAHAATIALEEADSLLERRAEVKLMVLAGVRESTDFDADLLNNDDGDVSSSHDGESSLDHFSLESKDDDADDREDYSGSSVGTEEHAGGDQPNDDEDEDCEYEAGDIIDDEDECGGFDETATQDAHVRRLEEEAFDQELRRITMEAIEKGKSAARTGLGGKVSDAMPSASQFVRKKGPDLLSVVEADESSKHALGGLSGVQFNFLKKGHKGRVEARSLLVPVDSTLAKAVSKQDDEVAREKNLLKARVLQYEVDNAEPYPTFSFNFAPKIKERQRPLSMEDIESNFGTGKDYTKRGQD